jgi:hypothetical protein
MSRLITCQVVVFICKPGSFFKQVPIFHKISYLVFHPPTNNRVLKKGLQPNSAQRGLDKLPPMSTAFTSMTLCLRSTRKAPIGVIN